MAEQKHQVILRFEEVSFSYPGIDVLTDTSFHIHSGEFIALVGPNGAGKSTILRLILGLETPSNGTISLFDRPVSEMKHLIGYVPQHAKFDPSFPISVSETVRMGRLGTWQSRYGASDTQQAVHALEMMGIADLANRPFKALSGGQRQRVLVARALAGNPSILIMDEPTANMDAQSEKNFYEALEKIKGEVTILIVTHDTSYVSVLTDRVLCAGDKGCDGHITKVVQHPLTIEEEGIGHTKRAKVLHNSEVNHSCDDEKGGR